MIKDADRYSCITCHASELVGRIESAQALGMKWMVNNSRSGRSNEVDLYIFFDDAGKENYLAHWYGDTVGGIQKAIDRPVGDDGLYERINEIRYAAGMAPLNKAAFAKWAGVVELGKGE